MNMSLKKSHDNDRKFRDDHELTLCWWYEREGFFTPGGRSHPNPNGTPVRPTQRNSKLCIKCCYFPCVLLGANINKFHCLPSCETAVPTGTPTYTKFCGHVQHVSSIGYPQWNLWFQVPEMMKKNCLLKCKSHWHTASYKVSRARRADSKNTEKLEWKCMSWRRKRCFANCNSHWHTRTHFLTSMDRSHIIPMAHRI